MCMARTRGPHTIGLRSCHWTDTCTLPSAQLVTEMRRPKLRLHTPSRESRASELRLSLALRRPGTSSSRERTELTTARVTDQP